MHVWFAVDNTVGFRLGSYRDGDLSVLQPTACVNITSSMKAIAKVWSVYKLIFAMCIIPHESKKTMTLLLLLSHPAIFVWSVWRDATHKSWMKSTPAHSSCHVCIRQTAVTSVQLTNLWVIIQQRVYQAKCRMWMIWGRILLICGLEWNRVLLTMILHEQWHRRIHACTRARRWYFEYWGW